MSSAKMLSSQVTQSKKITFELNGPPPTKLVIEARRKCQGARLKKLQFVGKINTLAAALLVLTAIFSIAVNVFIDSHYGSIATILISLSIARWLFSIAENNYYQRTAVAEELIMLSDMDELFSVDLQECCEKSEMVSSYVARVLMEQRPIVFKEYLLFLCQFAKPTTNVKKFINDEE